MIVESDTNPYSAPPIDDESGHRPSQKEVQVDFGVIIRRWERLRIYYNAALATFVIILTLTFVPQHFFLVPFWTSVMTGAVIANMCYFAGPLIEGYGTFFRKWNRTCTTLLFLAGLGFCAVLAAGCVLIYPKM